MKNKKVRMNLGFTEVGKSWRFKLKRENTGKSKFLEMIANFFRSKE